MFRCRSIGLCVLALMSLTFVPRSIAQEPSKDKSLYQASVGPSPSKLSVLYVGKPGSPRMAEFVAFLEKHFPKVGTENLESDFTTAAQSYDVVLLDWPPVYPRNADGKLDTSVAESNLTLPKLSMTEPISKPVVMIGAAAGTYVLQMRSNLAFDWKCLCLENYAHDTDTNHPIFKGPLPVEIAWEKMEKPMDYFLYPGTQKLGEMMQAWKVQARTFPDSDPGLVSSRDLLVNSKNAEVISGGVNGKGPTSVAIGRHGNHLLWGFSAPPSELSAPAQSSLINSLCYISAFDGQKPAPEPRIHDMKSRFLDTIYGLRILNEEHLSKSVEKMKGMIKDLRVPPEIKQKLEADPAGYMRQTVEPHLARVRETIPSDVREKFGDDTEALIAYYQENYSYLYSDREGRYHVDDDLKKLGIRLDSGVLIDRCARMLEDPAQTELAVNLLNRYVVGYTPSDAAGWKKMLADRNRWPIEYSPANDKYLLMGSKKP